MTYAKPCAKTCAMPRALLVTGGCRCGKSAFAQERAESLAPNRVFVATACWSGHDEEMAARVTRHRHQRGQGWVTFEPRFETEVVNADETYTQSLTEHIQGSLVLTYPALNPILAFKKAAAHGGVAVFDCVSLWVSHLLMTQLDDEAILAKVHELAACIANPPLPLVLVTNETGWGVVPSSALGRRFRDVAGEANQVLAAACEHVVLMVSGLPLVLKKYSV